ncbi:hypothetical protein [Micromonospora trifolii]|uniref:hypothetical protein n=1 Tax=Micromonospora trifolii TaxID=2911208 RepID=UPI003CF75089
MLSAAETPKVTDWMQGWGSLISLPLSFGALIFTGLLLRHELRTRRDERFDAVSAQARLVRTHAVVLQETEDESVDIIFTIKNNSERSIFRARIEAYMEGQRCADFDSDFLEVLDGCSESKLCINVPRARFAKECGFDLSVVLVYQDAEGYDWQREGDLPPVRAKSVYQQESMRELLFLYYVEPIQTWWYVQIDKISTRTIRRYKPSLRRKVWARLYGDHSRPNVGDDVWGLLARSKNWRQR